MPDLSLTERSIPGFDIEAFLTISEDPNRTQDILNIGKKMVEHPSPAAMFGALSEAASRSESLMRMYHERYLPRFPSLPELDSYPPGTLGKALARHLIDNKIDLEFAGLDTSHYYDKIKTPVDYLRMRALRCHDILHVVAGLDTSLLDEYSISAFQYGQFFSPFHSVVLASALIHFTFYRPEEAPKLMDAITRYHELGKRCELWLGVRWEDLWDRPLAELRKTYLLE